MKNKKWYLLGLGALVILLVIILQNTVFGYKEYVPLVWNGDEIVEARELLTIQHQEKIVYVLECYRENWKMKGGKVFVSKTIDDEMLWNYTTKADNPNDPIWLNNKQNCLD